MRYLIIILTVLLFLHGTVQVKASDALNVDAWSSLPILHEGRVKPIDSFARIMLKKFSTYESLNSLQAKEWLACSVFNPAEAVYLPIFKIRDNDIYGLPDQDHNLYNYYDLTQVINDKNEVILKLLDIPPEEWTARQQTLIELYEFYILYTQILRSLSLILPLSITDGKSGEVKNFLDYKKTQQILDQKTREIVRKKGTDLQNYTDKEREISFLSYQLNLLENNAQNNILMRIIPANWGNKSLEWVSPWAIIQAGLGSPKSGEYIGVWQEMASAYRYNDIAAWEESVNKAHGFFDLPKLKIEKLYNVFHLIQWALFLYAGALFFVIVQSLLRTKNKILHLSAQGFMALAIIAHFAHITLRVYILDRPPVGTLYESVLFVSLMCTIGFAYLSYIQKNLTGILLGALSGVLLLTTAQGFVGDDPMSQLVAVLNTNFWLGTHVLTITLGYATCLIASLMAHYHLAARTFGHGTKEFYKISYQNIKTVMILSLLLTTIGTILGGIWADQSWGRFWGWDPKENGALLIVLWIAWLLHGRISKHITQNGFVVGTAFLSIIVILAWFGVNLLNVGLHSYGFISGVATGVALFCLIETCLIGGLWYLGKDRKIG